MPGAAVEYSASTIVLPAPYVARETGMTFDASRPLTIRRYSTSFCSDAAPHVANGFVEPPGGASRRFFKKLSPSPCEGQADIHLPSMQME
jgi:hypothetical protein